MFFNIFTMNFNHNTMYTLKVFAIKKNTLKVFIYYGFNYIKISIFLILVGIFCMQCLLLD